jgi:iron complex transport system permease protein
MTAQFSFLSGATAAAADRFRLVLFLLCAALPLSLWAALCLGVVSIAPSEVAHIIGARIAPDLISTVSPPVLIDIVWDLRLPRALLSIAAGAGLALCGTVMQASVQNPLAEPYLLGVSAGASLGAAFAILSGSAAFFFGLGIAIWAFAGALVAAALVLALSSFVGSMSTVKIVLSGTAANALFTGLTNFVIYLSGNADGMRTVTFWTMGSFAAASWENVALPLIAVFTAGLYFALRPRMLNTLLLGEEAAVTLGIDLPRIRRQNLLISALLTAVIVSVCGVFAFVGLIVPHIVRGLAGADHRRLLPAVFLGGSVFMLWSEILSRVLLPGGELPIGIITSLIGAPFFIYILLKRSDAFGNR